jgi:hypothetical protein
MLTLVWRDLFPVALITVALFAWWRGQWPERVAAGLFVTAWVLSRLLTSDARHMYLYVEIGVLLVDATLTVALAWLAIRSGRGWVIWATAFLLLSTTAHLARALDSSLTALAYAIMAGVAGYPTVILLAFGTWRHPRPPKPKPADGF